MWGNLIPLHWLTGLTTLFRAHVKSFVTARTGSKLSAQTEMMQALVPSPDLRNSGYQVYIPPSLILKRAFANGIPLKYSDLKIVNRISPDEQAKIMGARPRTKNY